jgi:hypothetical protein
MKAPFLSMHIVAYTVRSSVASNQLASSVFEKCLVISPTIGANTVCFSAVLS